MEKLKKVAELYALDWRRIFKNKITFILMIALMIIPSLYAWFNIEALWDPYSNTGDLKIAVYSDDQEAKVMDQKVLIGDQVLDNLKENESLDWQFVDSKETLDRGVKSGKYYAGIYLPSDFSKNLVSFVTGDIKHPKIVYSVNEKINAIAPKISDKGAGTLQETITSEFIGTASKTLLTVLNEIGFNLDANLPSIKKMTSKILALDDNLDVIDGYTKEVLTLNQKMPEINKKLAMANEFVDYLPEVNQMGQKVVTLNQKVPEIEKMGGLVGATQAKIPQIKNAGQQVAMIDNDFDSVVNTMDRAIVDAKNGLTIIQDAQKVLPQVNELANSANTLIPQVQESMNQIQAALPNIASGVDSGLTIVIIVSQETAELTSNLAGMIDENNLSQASLDAIHAHLVRVSERLSFQASMINGQIDVLNQLKETTGTQALDGVIQRLNGLLSVVQDAEQKVDNVLANWENLINKPSELSAALNQISQLAATINQEAASIPVGAITQAVNETISEAQQMLTIAGNVTGSIVNQQLINRVEQLMGSTSETVQTAISFLEKYRKEMPAVKDEIHSVNELLNGNMNLIIASINGGANFFQEDFPVLKNKLNRASNFIQQDLPGIETDVTKTLKLANEKAPKLEEALTMATGLIQNDWPNIKKSISKASDLIRKGEKDVDLSEIIKLLKSDSKAESDFLSSPVQLETKQIYKIPNYGSASTPFYTALCLWVGAILFSSIASTKFSLDLEQEKRYSKRQQFLARMLTFITVGIGQTVIVVLGNQFMLGAYTKNPIWNMLFALLISFSFMMIVYVLVALFGNLGKGIAIIILVLSISAGAGNFPIEMSGPFFRAINPYIPFTHAVNLLRESVGGIYWPSAIKAIVILISVTIVFFVGGLLCYPKADKLFSHLNTELKKGKILH